MPTTANPLVSVMIPYYNCKEYIAETIASVEAQSYPDIEIIVIDDGSRQEDAAYLQNLLAGKSHIRFAVQPNCGVAAARNHAARLASGKYFLFLDADDTILPEYIEKCVNVLENDATCKLVYPQAEFFDAQSGVWELPAYEGFKSLLLGNRFIITSLHRAADYAELDGFDETFKTHEDWDYWIRLLQHGGGVCKIPEVLFRYRKRQDRSSLIDKLEGNVGLNREDWQRIYEKNSRLFLENGLGYFELADIKRRYEKITASPLYKFICFFKKKEIAV